MERTAFRVEPELLAQADALRALLPTTPTRSAILRAAVVRGLEVLRREAELRPQRAA